jgi:hypothetical protein
MRQLRRKTGGEAVRRNVLLQLAFLGCLGYGGRFLVEQRLEVDSTMHFEARPCNQEDGGVYGNQRKHRDNRVLAVRRRRLPEILVREGMALSA